MSTIWNHNVPFSKSLFGGAQGSVHARSLIFKRTDHQNTSITLEHSSTAAIGRIYPRNLTHITYDI